MASSNTQRLEEFLLACLGFGCALAPFSSGAANLLFAHILDVDASAAIVLHSATPITMGLSGLLLRAMNQRRACFSVRAVLPASSLLMVAGYAVAFAGTVWSFPNVALAIASVCAGGGLFPVIALWYKEAFTTCHTYGQPTCVVLLVSSHLVSSLAESIVATLDSQTALFTCNVGFVVISACCLYAIEHRRGTAGEKTLPPTRRASTRRTYHLVPYAFTLLCSFGITQSLAFCLTTTLQLGRTFPKGLALCGALVVFVAAVALSKNRAATSRLRFGSLIRYLVTVAGVTLAFSPLLVRVSPSALHVLSSGILVLNAMAMGLFSIEVCRETNLGFLDVFAQNFAVFACSSSIAIFACQAAINGLDPTVALELLAAFGALAMALVIPILPNRSCDASMFTLSTPPEDETFDQRLSRAAANIATKFGLSEREGEVLSLLVAGMTYQEIADKLSLSIWTVGDHAKSIYSKTGLHSNKELIMLAARGE